MSDKNENRISIKNSEFWDELCGTSFALENNINEINETNLLKFDKAFMEYYPYLQGYLNELKLENKKILEIGLGYGTVGQILATHGESYIGVDIAEGPVKMMNYRLLNLGFENNKYAMIGDALKLPFKDNEFDVVVTIGCLHHTGNLKLAVSEIERVCRSSGKILFMTYNKHSLRNIFAPIYFILFKIYSTILGKNVAPNKYSEFIKWLRDSRVDGTPPPFTEFVTTSEIHTLFSSSVPLIVEKRNLGKFKIPFINLKLRKYLLGWLDKLIGLDIYVICKKK